MWSYFRSKAALAERLAIERTRREMLERENRTLQERLDRTDLEFARLRDAVLTKQGTIAAPLRTEPAAPPHPLVGALASLGITEWDGKVAPGSNPLSAPSMPDE